MKSQGEWQPDWSCFPGGNLVLEWTEEHLIFRFLSAGLAHTLGLPTGFGPLPGAKFCLEELLCPADQKAARQLFEASLPRRLPFAFLFRPAAGADRWLRAQCAFAGEADRVYLYVSCSDAEREMQARDACRAAEQRFAAAVESADCSVWLNARFSVWEYETATRRLHFSRNTYKANGLPDEVAEAPRVLAALLVKEDRPLLQAFFREIEAGGPFVNVEVRLLPLQAGGPVRFERLSCSVQPDEKGRPFRALGLGQNITQQRRMEQKYSRAIHRMLADNPTALCIFHLNLSHNSYCEGTSMLPPVKKSLDALSLQTADQLVRLIAQRIPDPQESARFGACFDRLALLRRFHEGVDHVEQTCHLRGEEDRMRWVTTRFELLQNPFDNNVEAIVCLLDADRSKKEEAIIDAITGRELEYIGLLNSFSNTLTPYCRFSAGDSPAGDFLQALPALTAGLPQEEGRTKFFSLLMPGRIQKALARGPEYTLAFACADGAGGERRKQLSFRYLEPGQPEILVTRSDVTAAFRREEAYAAQLRMALLEAEKANEMKSDFLGNVSHDMRTPLNAILNYNELALGAAEGPQREEYLRKIRQAGRILLSLINDTLDLQKIENGTTALHLQPVRCRELFSDISASVRPLMEQKSLHFTVDTGEVEDLTLMADGTRLQELFLNLLSNAAKFTPPGGRVEFKARCEADGPAAVRACLTVRDTGIGMSSAFLTRLYEPFSQERTPETASIGGSGLGLSIAKRLVELMGGSIEVSSQLGQGTEFCVRLRFLRAEETAIPAAVPLTAPGSLQGLRVLLCEDNRMNTEIVQSLLGASGVQLTCASNGAEGLRLFDTSSPGTFDAILMDIRMPVMDGYTAARAIRASRRPDAARIPILAMSADAYESDVRRALACGMDAHLAKPLDPARLLGELYQRTRGGRISSADSADAGPGQAAPPAGV